ncbi:MAG: hypothetical protein P1V36_08045, partial [Planctomycetota bacterium]|nr:hypothetical protein [Planctomycetota bacterium]
MFKRIFMLALVLMLPALMVGGASELVLAKDDPNTTADDWLTDGTIQGYKPDAPAFQGLPDRKDLSAHFLVVDGFGNNGLGAQAGAGQLNSFKLTFARAAVKAQVALFD